MKNVNLIASLAMVLACSATTQAALFDVETKIMASDAAGLDLFGVSVAISGNTALVGKVGEHDLGAAYLFNVTTGNQLAKLTAGDPTAGFGFGSTVAISGHTALVGTRGLGSGDAPGSAYLFDVNTGNQIAKLTAADAAADDNFGVSVAISGNTALVGAVGDDEGGHIAGAAYLFDVTTGNQLAKLTADDASAVDAFGVSVAISGNTALVGAIGDDGGGSRSGSAYLFDVTTGNQITKLIASDAAASDNFGRSVAISGNTALVGAWHSDDGGSSTGSAYLFDITTGNQIAKLTAPDASAANNFGGSVAISGNRAIVGAWFDGDGGRATGSAYLFDVTTGNQLGKLTASDAALGDQFGRSVAISGNTALVGAYVDDDGGYNSGSAYLFENDIPEPSTLLLGVMACLGLLQRRNR